MTHVQFISFLFELEMNAQIAHWKSKYAPHIALGEVYEAVEGFRDTYAEILQRDDLLKGFEPPVVREDVPPVILIKNAISIVERYRAGLTQSHLQNEVDTLISSLSGSLYKLKHL